MKKNLKSKSGIFSPRVFLAFFLGSVGVALATFSLIASTSSSATVAVVAPQFESTPSAQAHTVSLPSFVREPIEATFQWIASFGGSGGPRGSTMRRSAANSGATGGGVLSLVPVVGEAINATISPAARDLAALNPVAVPTMAREEGQLPNRVRQGPLDPLEVDPVIQRSATTTAMPAVGASFPGINIEQACEQCLPPDTNGAVGPNHYVQMVNSSFQVFDKATGAPLLPTHPCAINTGNQCAPYINSLWMLTPNSECFQNNSGDPIVIYDQLADRWVLSQFVASASPKYAQCIAISTSPDPTGTYYLYEFDESADTFHDYPHIGVWPDGYYMSTNLFSPNAVVFSDGAGAWAFERPKMLLGQPARYVYFNETGLSTGCTQGSPPCTYVPNGQLPTSLEGKNLPPAGTPNYFVEVDDTNTPDTPPAAGLHDEMHIWKFHVDWTNPANSTFGTGSTVPALQPGFPGQYAANAGQPNFIVPIADFLKSACQIENGSNDCAPEKLNPPLAAQYLDVLGDRLMHRLTYRNFGDHESLLVNHSVDAQADQPMGATRTGVRWYELRNISTTPTVYQQSTFAPLPDPNDPTSVTNGPLWRWMGSAAMDHSGDIAIGYSASGPNYFPSLHYAGRLSNDPLGELTQGEAVMFLGQGIEVNTGIFPFRNRWGDYSALQVDPADDCTFWYTNEYNATNPPIDPNNLGTVLPVDWQTRIGSFKFPSCTPPALQLVSVVSRKTHGSITPPFDINLPLTPPRGVECRGTGSTNNYTLVFTFNNYLQSVGSAQVTAHDPVTGTGTVSSTVMGPGLKQYTVNLSNVSTGQYITVTLNSVLDSLGNSANFVSPQMGVLVGDVNADGAASNLDVSLVKAKVAAGASVDSSNFRDDVNADGGFSNLDVSITKAQVAAGQTLPSPP